MLGNALFTVIFQGLALWAICAFLAAVLPSYYGLRLMFESIAKPATFVVARITPAIVPVWFHSLLAAVWLMSVRVMFYLVMANYGLLPKAGP